MIEFWNRSKADATETETFEYAAYMYIDTRGGYPNWYFDWQRSPVYNYNQTEYQAVYPPIKEDHCFYRVGAFHTHPA